jgi:hypothetical protein
MEHAKIIEWLRDAGMIGVLVFIMYGGYKRWWVWGYQAEELRTQLADMRRERDAWQAKAMEGADKSVQLAQRAVDLLSTPQR